jgi:predicted DNA-binding transcriptional regulator AlpA
VPKQKQSINSPPASLPLEGYARMPTVRAVAGNVGSSTIWLWVKKGVFPKPVKLGPNVTAWRVDELRDWLATKRGK